MSGDHDTGEIVWTCSSTAVMIRLPYGKTVDYCGVAEIAQHWNCKGYAFVGQDCRGTYGSGVIQDGILRMGLREPERGRRLLEPGRVYEVEVDLWAIAYRLPAGHRLRVEISSSEVDRYDRNLNTAALPGRGSEMVVARQTVFHDAARPSHVRIPVRPVLG